MKVSIYARVSKSKQELRNQLTPLQEFVAKRGYRLVKIYEDIATGKNSDREGFNEMMRDAHQGKFDAIVVWALDRLSREGLYKTIHLIQHLTEIKVDVISYSEPFLDTTNELARNILLAVLATLAKAKRDKISERTKAGLERAKREGKKIGRPAIDLKTRKKAIEMVKKKKLGVRETAKYLGLSPAYVSTAANSS